MGTKSITSNNGVFTFTDIQLSRAGNYKLKATVDDISIISHEITINHKDIHEFNITGLPLNEYVNNPLNYDISLQIKDNDGDLILKDYNFTIDISGTGRHMTKKYL